ncbi:hypothetical protein ACB098_01G011400 [Castanea mollissima]
MDKDSVTRNNTNNNNNNNVRGGGGEATSSFLRPSIDSSRQQATTSSDFGFQWGNRKRLRCMKIQVKDKDHDSAGPVHRTTVRVDRRVVRADKDSSNSHPSNKGYLNLRHRPSSSPPPPPQRILRNSAEITSSAMRGGQSNGGGVRGIVASPDRAGAHDKKVTHTNHNSHHHHHHHHQNENNINNHNKSAAAAGSSETAHDSKKGGGGGSSSGGSGDAGVAGAGSVVWPPKFVIALTNKEKEEDFMAIKGSKLPQRPKKRAKFIQRTLNLVSPGAWLCDLTLERYEVREKKISKKRPRGLKAMGNMESDSE